MAHGVSTVGYSAQPGDGKGQEWRYRVAIDPPPPPLAASGDGQGDGQLEVQSAEPFLNAMAVGTITSHRYTLDGVGNRTRADELAGVGSASGLSVYALDELDRLTRATYPGTTPAKTYTYDKSANRASVQVGTTRPTAYAYDGAGRLTSDGTNSYTYDKNGNQTKRGRTDVYEYDGANRLAKHSASNTSYTYQYDGDGLRVNTNGAAPNAVNYLWDVNRGLPVVLYDGSAYYVYGLGSTPIARITAGATPQAHYYHGDGLGSVRAVTDGGGGTVLGYDYEAFGEQRTTSAATGAPTNAYRYTGEAQDERTKFYYLRARHYDPATGRFTQPDPLGYAGGGKKSPRALVTGLTGPLCSAARSAARGHGRATASPAWCARRRRRR